MNLELKIGTKFQTISDNVTKYTITGINVFITGVSTGGYVKITVTSKHGEDTFSLARIDSWLRAGEIEIENQ